MPVVLCVLDGEHAPEAVALRAGLGSDVEFASAEGAVRAAADRSDLRGLVLVRTPLSADTIELLAEWDEVPVLAVADPAHRGSLRSTVDAYLASRHPDSDITVDTADVVRWVTDRLRTTSTVEEVALTSDDGWELHGTRWLPAAEQPVPGVVLLHSGRSDRAVFSTLERLLAERGLAVLNLDWRGRGRSTNRGSYFSLSAEERAEGWRDVAAALDHLASLPEVDAGRLAAVGVVHGAEHAARAAQRDPRVRALVLLTGYRPAEDAEGAHLTSGAVDVLYVTSTDHTVTTDAMRQLYDASSSPLTRYVEYPGGAIGYQLFEIDRGLEAQIVSWLAEVLT